MKIMPMLALAVFLPMAGLSPARAQTTPQRTTPGLTLTSPAFEDCSVIPDKYTQAVAKYVSPELQWTNVPPNTASFVLLTIDPEGIVDKTTEPVVHWLIFNIPGTTREIAEGVPAGPHLPDGSTQVKNRRGFPAYLGMGAPAAGPYHHYTFQIIALDTKLELGPDATRADIFKAMDGHILDRGVLVGRFHRP